MENLLTLLTILTAVFSGLFLGRLVTIIVHVLGHGITALLISKATVALFIGEMTGGYFLIKKPLHRRLDIYFCYFPSLWYRGSYFLANTVVDTRRRIIIALSGPIASLLLAVTALFIIFDDSYFVLTKIFCGPIFIFAFMDFLSLIPREKKYHVFSTPFYNDGETIKQLIKRKSFEDSLQPVNLLYAQQSYKEAITQLQQLLDKGYNEIVFQHLLHCYIVLEDVPNVIKTTKMMEEQFEVPTKLYNKIGVWHAFGAESYEEALRCFEKAIEKRPNYLDALNNKAFLFICLGQNEQAIELFSQTIELDPASAYSYSNRGLAKIISGDVDGGLKDIQTALELDPNEAYALRSMGLYHLEMNDHQQALQNFEQAKALNPDVYQIDKLISHLS